MAARVVTQAYGGEAFRAQALYLAWSTLAWRGGAPVDVHVYTDDAAYFRALEGRIDLRVMSRAEIAAWRGPYDFTHRLKPLMVQDMVRRFPADPLLYLDADTFWVRSLDRVLARIGPGRSVMHAREDRVSDPGDRHMRNFSRHLRRLSFRGGPIDVERWMWNAGAIGLDPSAFAAVDDWIAFIDEVWPRYRRGLVEQYGIGMLLQQRGEVVACDDRLFHYWYQKDEYVAAIQRELDALRALPLDDALVRLREDPVHVSFRERSRVGTPFARRMRRSFFGER